MAKVGRKPHSDPPVFWKVSIPKSISDQIEILFADPVTGAVQYGARAALVQELLTEWLRKKQRQPSLESNNPPSHFQQ